MNHMKRAVTKLERQGHLRRDPSFKVVDFGSQAVNEQVDTSRGLFDGCSYVGVDITAGPNVDVIMSKPYSTPIRSGSVDLVISSQVFEHIPFPWASILELARIAKPGGHIILIAPSRGHKHSMVDCWRYYPDAYRALAAFAGLRVLKVDADFPTTRQADRPGRWDYASVPDERYWGDAVALLRKPSRRRFDPRLFVVRAVVLWWANSRRYIGSHSH